MNDKLTGIEAARAKVEKIKEETAQAEEQKEEQRVAVKGQLAAIQENSALAQMYKDAAGAGNENLGGELPQLKIHTLNKSENNELADGGEPNDGYFFLKSEGKQFETVHGYVLAISEGFRAEGIPDPKTGQKKMVFNQLMSLMIDDDGDYKAAIMYFSGVKLQNLWDFGKKAARFTKGRMKLPLYALRVTLTTEKAEHSYGKSWVAKIEIDKTPEGEPVIVLDEGLFTFLKDSREQAVETLDRMIAAKVPENATELVNEAVPQIESSTDAELIDEARSEGVTGDEPEIPF